MLKSINPRIYIVEDDPGLNKLLEMHLVKCGFNRTKGFLSGEELFKNLDVVPDIIVQDYDLPGMNGVEVLKKAKKINPNIDFIFLSGQQSIEVAVDAMKYGAFDYLIKDSVAKDKLVYKIKKLILIQKLKNDKNAYKYGIIGFAILLVLSWLVIGLLKYNNLF